MAPCVLVADDESSFRESVAEVLWTAGYRVVTAANGREALDLVGREHPSAVVLDLDLPVVSGRDFLRIMHAELPDLPVILASEAEPLPEGAFATLPRPFRLGSLLAALASTGARP